MPEIEPAEPPSPTFVKRDVIDKAAEELRAKRELPKKPGDRVEFRELVEWLDLLTNEQLPRLNIYVYRLEPIISRQTIDPEADNNIDCIYDVRKENLTEQYFIDTHGGGKYRLIIKDLDKPKVQKGGFFEASLYIPMTLYPPKLDYREVEWDNPRNKGFKAWARSQKLIDDNGMPTIEKKDNPQSNNSDAMVQAMKLAMDFASKMDEKQQNQLKRQLGAEDTLGKSIGDILVEKMRQDDPNKQLATMTTLISAMKGMQPEVRQQENGLATMIPIFTAMMESSKQQFMMMMEVLKGQRESNPSQPVDRVEELKSLIEVAKMIKGGPTPEKSTAEVIGDIVSPMITPILSIVANVVAMKSASMGVAGVPPQQTTPQANGQSPTTPKAIEQGNPNMTIEQKQQILKQFAPLILKAMGSAKEGWEFAGDVENLFGVEVVSILTKDGAESLIAVAKSVPEFWNGAVNTYGEPHIVKWVTSFVNYKEEIAKMESEEEIESTTT